MSRNRWLLVVLALFVAWQVWTHHAPNAVAPAGTTAAVGSGDEGATRRPSSQRPADTRRTERPTDTASSASNASNSDNLPPEAITTLQLIRNGGPFPYDRDGIVFGNFEGRLPKQKRGYYHEYTVPTPGVSHRGARRIIAGGKPPNEFYYTDDHYESFRQVGGAQ